MKTAISIDDKLLSEADRVARDMGLSRSRLVAIAVESYLRVLRQAEITQRLNDSYALQPADDTQLVKRMKSKFRSTITDQW